MKTAIISLSVAILIVGLFLWGKFGSANPADSAVLATGVTSARMLEHIPAFDFGSVSMMRGNIEHEFRITNETGDDVTLTEAETSCMCTRAVVTLPDGKERGPFGMPGHGFPPSLNSVVRSGESVTIRAIFDPAAHGPAGVGLVERAVTLMSDKGSMMMQLSAQVTP